GRARQLHRDVAIECRIPPPVDGAERAGPDDLEQHCVSPVPGWRALQARIILWSQRGGSMRVDDLREAAELLKDLFSAGVGRLSLCLIPIDLSAVRDGGSERDEPGILRRIAQLCIS